VDCGELSLGWAILTGAGSSARPFWPQPTVIGQRALAELGLARRHELAEPAHPLFDFGQPARR
jgi:hypothetical protein